MGFCFSEGLIADLADIALVHHCGQALPTMMEDNEAGLEQSRNRVRITYLQRLPAIPAWT